MTLEVPDPDSSDSTEPPLIAPELGIGLALSALLVVAGWLFWIQPQTQQQGDHHGEESTETADSAPVDSSGEGDEPSGDGELPEDSIGRLTPDDPDDLKERRRQMARFFETGPRERAETICSHFAGPLEEGRTSRETRRILRQGVSRRAEQTPWTCLTKLYLEDRLPGDSELTRELDEFWEDVASREDYGEIMATVVDDLADDRRRLEVPEFERWVRRCALDLSYDAARACQKLVRTKYPETGDDLLEVLTTHLGAEQLPPDEYHDRYARDLTLAAEALSHFARFGQPPGWVVAETDQLPDYETQFRRGAVFQMCRMMNAPDEDVQSRIAEAFGETAEIADRPLNPNMLHRWRETCRMTFGDPEQPRDSVPILGVSVVRGDQRTVDYGFETLQEQGMCEVPEGAPDWYCGARRWTGSDEPTPRVLADYFAETGYMEWDDPDEVADVIVAE